MKTIGKIVAVVALTIFSLNANAQEVKKTTSISESNLKTETKIDKPVSKRFENKTQKRKLKPINKVPVRKTTVKHEAVKG